MNAVAGVAGSEERSELEAHARLGYRPELDGVRALAILPVVFFHAYANPEGGFLGVDVFFVLSGFLITTLLLQEWQASDKILLGHFYLRRALRLLPALFVALAFYVMYTAATSFSGATHDVAKFKDAVESAAYSALYVSNVFLAIGTPHISPTVGHLWSLATEEQFYLLWPLVLLFALRAGASWRLLSGGLASAIVVLFVNRTVLALHGASHARLYFAPDAHFDVLLVGCLAGVWFAYGRIPALIGSRRFLLLAVPLLLAGVAVLFAITNIRAEALPDGLLTAFAVAVGLMLLSVVLHRESVLARMLRVPPLVFIGKISYALYLWHPLVFLAGAGRAPLAVNVVLAFVAATLSYYLVELPFLRLKRRDRERVDAATASRTEPHEVAAT